MSQKKSKVQKKSLQRSSKKAKYIFVTGGVISSLGKGLTVASLGTLFSQRGFSVGVIKCDPYINVDPGTMSPFQHGEVFVTDDGAETDLDLGHYERFFDVNLTKDNSVTAGQIYDCIIRKERKGSFLGSTVQVIPHITNEIKKRILNVGKNKDLAIVEIGGTVGDIEGLPFLEAIRQMQLDLGFDSVSFVHVTYLPYIPSVEEIKTKPTQHSVKALREIGIQPQFLICRSSRQVSPEVKKKVSLFCNVSSEKVVSAVDSKSIYDIPIKLHEERLDIQLIKHFGLPLKPLKLTVWKKMLRSVMQSKKCISVGIVGKYVALKDSYKSVEEALVHGAAFHNAKIDVQYIDAEAMSKTQLHRQLKGLDALLIPGGFGERGSSGKLLVIEYARKNKVPFLGICLGMQLAIIEYARNVCGLKKAHSSEFEKTPEPVISLMEEQHSKKHKGGSMRLGSYDCSIKKGTLAYKIYKKSLIKERHRHRYEVNNDFIDKLIEKGCTVSGGHLKMGLVEIIELKDHPWFVGVQFHPEFKSKPIRPHPLFCGFVQAGLLFKNSKMKR